MRYVLIIMFGFLILGVGCDFLQPPDNEYDTETDADADSDTDADGDTDSDADGDMPSEKWVFVFPKDNDIQVGSDLPLALGSDGTIYIVATAFGNGALLYAVDSDGEQKWVNTDLPTQWDDDCDHPVLSEATNTIYVVCDEEVDKVYHSTVYAISTSGVLKWATDLPQDVFFAQQIALYTDGNNPPIDHLLVLNSTTLPVNGIYEIDSTGTLEHMFLVKDNPLYGLAVDHYNNVITRTDDGTVYKLNSNLQEIWTYNLSMVSTTFTNRAISIGHDNTIYIATPEPKLYAIAEDDLGAPYEKWTWDNSSSQMSEPVIGADGTIYVQRHQDGIVALDPEDGSEIWSGFLSHSYIPAMIALEDGTILAGSGTSYGLYDINDPYSYWSITSDGNNSPAVALDGSIYGMGQFETNVSNALYAYQWNLAPSEIGWYRGNGDNANTRWAGSN